MFSTTYTPGQSEKNDFLYMYIVHFIQLCACIKPPFCYFNIFFMLFIFAFVNFVYLDIVYILSIKSVKCLDYSL